MRNLFKISRGARGVNVGGISMSIGGERCSRIRIFGSFSSASDRPKAVIRGRGPMKWGVLASLLMSAYPPPCLLKRLPRALAPTCVALLIGLMIGRSAAASPTPPDPRIGSVIEELEKTRKIRQVSLSPDGQMIAWAVDGQSGIEIQVAPKADPSHPHRLTA